MFKRILVPLDGSSTAEIVLPYVIDIAPKCGSGIVLTRVAEPDISVEKCRSYLESTAEKLKSKLKVMQTMGQIQIDLRVLMGNPTYEILNCASDLECDLIALASRGASSRSQWPLGNVAAKILRASGRPILLVRKQVNDLPTAGKSLIKKIMVPLDGSRLSEASLPYAIILSQRLAAEVVLFRAIEPAVVITGSGEAITRLMAPEYTVTAISSRMKPFVLEYMNSIKNILEKQGLKPSVSVVEGSAADQIINYCEASSVDLIVMSTHGLSGIGRWAFGSVTDKVLHGGDTPVFVIRPILKSE